jgi:hypothetical protein
MVKPKLLVERISGKNATKKRYPIKNGRVIINKGGLGPKDVKYDPPYDPARIAETTFLFFKTYKAYYVDGAKELMPLVPNGQPPEFTAEPILKAAEAKLLEKQAKVSGQTTTLEYFILLGIVVLIGMGFAMLNALGVINLGTIVTFQF